MLENFYYSLFWILAAALLGFIISAVFSDRFRWSRRVFLIPYILFTGTFTILFLRSVVIDIPELLVHNWAYGLIAGVLVGAFLVRNVWTQPASRQTTGPLLAWDIIWVGLAYGITDGVFLNVLPVLAIQSGVQGTYWQRLWPGGLLVGLGALLASLLVTLAYHAGYREFRNSSMRLVLFGNGLITLAYLLSGNPLGALVSHGLMHVAAVLHGPETTLQLPPHSQN
jgi:hypothetical protein